MAQIDGVISVDLEAFEQNVRSGGCSLNGSGVFLGSGNLRDQGQFALDLNVVGRLANF